MLSSNRTRCDASLLFWDTWPPAPRALSEPSRQLSEPSRQPSQWQKLCSPSALDMRVTEIEHINQSLSLWLECISSLQVATGSLVFEPFCRTELLTEASRRRLRIRISFNATSSKSRVINLPIRADIPNFRKLKSRCKTLQEGGGEENASRNVHL